MHITGQIHVDKAGPAPCRMEFRKGRTEKEGGEITDRIQMKRMVVGSRMGAVIVGLVGGSGIWMALVSA